MQHRLQKDRDRKDKDNSDNASVSLVIGIAGFFLGPDKIRKHIIIGTADIFAVKNFGERLFSFLEKIFEFCRMLLLYCQLLLDSLSGGIEILAVIKKSRQRIDHKIIFDFGKCV